VRFVFCWLIFSHFGFLDRFFYVYVSPANMMEGNSSDWTKQEIEKIVIWLEDPTNVRRTQKGSGETKKRWINAIASTISSRTEAQVGYKFDNLKKSYREALRLADQSGWGLDEEDLQRGSSLHGMSLTID